jgi:hypothetical protein
VRVLGAGIQDSFSKEKLQLTCVSKDYLNSDQRFKSCDLLGFILTDVVGTMHLSVLPVSLPEQQDLDIWFKKNIYQIFPKGIVTSPEVKRKRNSTAYLYSSVATLMLAGTTSGILFGSPNNSKNSTKAVIGFSVGLATTWVALVAGFQLSDKVKPKHFLSFNNTKEEFFNRSKESWQFNPTKIKHESFLKIAGLLLQSTIQQ